MRHLRWHAHSDSFHQSQRHRCVRFLHCLRFHSHVLTSSARPKLVTNPAARSKFIWKSCSASLKLTSSQQGVIFPGETALISVKALVDDKVASKLNVGLKDISTTLAVRAIYGRDTFVPVKATWGECLFHPHLFEGLLIKVFSLSIHRIRNKPRSLGALHWSGSKYEVERRSASRWESKKCTERDNETYKLVDGSRSRLGTHFTYCIHRYLVLTRHG